MHHVRIECAFALTGCTLSFQSLCASAPLVAVGKQRRQRKFYDRAGCVEDCFGTYGGEITREFKL